MRDGGAFLVWWASRSHGRWIPWTETGGTGEGLLMRVARYGVRLSGRRLAIFCEPEEEPLLMEEVVPTALGIGRREH